MVVEVSPPQVVIEISPQEFDLQKITESGQCFRMKRIQYGKYEVVAFGKYLKLEQDNHSVTFHCSVEEYTQIWSTYFDMMQSYNQITNEAMQSFGGDKFLMDAICEGQGIRILHQELFETLISFIISQRKSIPSIRKAIETLCQKYGEPIYIDSNNRELVRYAFPSAESLAVLNPEDLADCHVGYRDKYIIAAARWYLQHHDTYNLESMGFQTAVNILRSEIYGVGIKVASCVCLFGLHQLESCPIDVWMQRIIDEDYGSDIPRWMDTQHAGVLQQYCFYYKRNS